MAKKISAFQELTDLSANDYMAIIDDSEIIANRNKRVTVSTLDSRYKVTGTDLSLDNLDVAGDTGLLDVSINGSLNVVGNLDVSGDTSLGNLTTGGPIYNTNFGDYNIDVGHQQINLNYNTTNITGEINLSSIRFTGLVTYDPNDSGKLWNDNGTLKISNG